MSLLFMSIAGAILATVEDAIDRRHERNRWTPKRARQYTFN